MEEKIYHCIVHGPVPVSEVEFGPEPEALVSGDPTQDIRTINGVTAQFRMHKGCGQPVEQD